MATAIKNRITEKNGQEEKVERVTITPPNMKILTFTIQGTSPLVINRFSHKSLEKMRGTQEAGSLARKGGKREPKNFRECFEDAKHVSPDGWCGLPANGLRSACVSACSLVGFHMTKGKKCLFIEADGYDRFDGMPLVKITKGEPRQAEHHVKNDGGSTDLRARPMWDPGWQAVVRVRFDADMFLPVDVLNLFSRVGAQIGIGAGRADSSDSCGCGWGFFEVLPT